MITLTVNLIGFCLVGLIIWWFILKKPKSTRLVNNAIQVVVDEGVYEPSILKAREGKMITLEFIRKDKSPCAQVVVFNTLDISQELKVNKLTKITINSLKSGTYPFSCQMGMYQGSLIVE
ncbi:MAG: cupredoxin domain-containing protein [Legionellaceae bacterium]|uniref:EfeO-type cupredoxin-like domain-containing protein n=1 Tax=Legionella spiritensis TaxID=452 RepID=A0A0W0YZ72_LEGSP|nr:cupredoxin domain-containing protein [Legionella spiritensis]KTD62202.1 hypothetical protein Lspi_2052 [Legionella spiritensis]MBJ15890.1 cupredoxin domain-containing protein [Legionellaceae bacterium]SNV29223.1 Uncharacterized protein conserved in bacteria [Legionella spiritensis]HAF87492.1 cupredoxin domain-containing protein [Legionellales bacterium]|tara:strand:+ start:1345 stop:1704 length:360 start_codon:yes stop_codon:yes gene_type:complete